jgi:hypothetical protein
MRSQIPLVDPKEGTAQGRISFNHRLTGAMGAAKTVCGNPTEAPIQDSKTIAYSSGKFEKGGV